ncbi:hypothetical protein C8Q70DRAFT_971440 [Cubamyces menziesii]|nr:hypothetical protein C8Q70DRAFT_971440 [Cubamyces menziesii]
MVVSVALWSLAATPGEPSVISPPGDIRITNIALGDQLADESGRTTVKLIYRRPGADDEESDEEDDEEDEEKEMDNSELSTTVLCSLTPGKIEQSTVDVVLNEDEEYLIEVVGKNTVYLTGNYIDQSPFDQDPYGEDEDDMSDEEDYDLEEVSSDVEINPDELDIPSDDEDRFEEIQDDDADKSESKTDSKKRPRDSDAMETEEQEGKLSKAQQKKQKKLKAANGEAVPTATADKAEKADEKKSKQEKKKEKAEKEKPKAQTKTVAGGVKVTDHKTGSGPQAKAGDMVSMRYIGKLENGKIFDQNTKGKPFKFRLGKGEVIKGWDVGIVGMQPGGERLLTIPAPMAYGKVSQPGIPANSTLIFEVKLLSIN